MYSIKNNTFFRKYFVLFSLLNVVFLALQLFYFCMISVHFTHSIPMPRFVYLVILAEIILQIILYLLLTMIQLGWLWGIANRLRNPTAASKPAHLTQWLLLIFVSSTIFLLTINCYFFPLSRLSRLFLLEVSPVALNVLLILSSLFLAGLTLNTLRCLCLKKSVGGFIVAGLAIFLFINHYPATEAKFAKHKNPTIILIGVDSLSPDYVNKKNTPTLDHFLRESVHFTETISPLARTYPAWVSILTGLYPLHHRARENLVPIQFAKSEASIVWKLRELGYSTLFATDDRRFSNLDQEFGFQKIVGPKIGINEMLLGGFYDFPLSNLLINSKISHWLFPYNYINRASNYAYYPETFDNAIENTLNDSAHAGPLFLAVHFTLPHWPYSWATSSAEQDGDEMDMKANKTDLYTTALSAVDQQVSTLLTHLSHHNLLANSLVIVLSDHGETLYQKGSRITALENYQETSPSPLASYFKHKTSTSLEKSTGHGSDLLSPTQFHCLLGMTIFHNGKPITTAKTIATRVALIDIAPTIYAFLNRHAPHEKRHFDGISLLPTVLGEPTPLRQRAFMLESGLLPNQILTPKKAIFYARLLYQVNKENNLLEIRPDELNEVNGMKLYGILKNDWLLVLYPNDTNYLTVLVQLSNHQWTDQPNSSFAKKSPLNKLLKQLRTFYKIELLDYPSPSLRS
ncbi:MAG: hypothetical protein A3F46_02925 [Legionellales bacterium RIFCSPHIGHO2_12_FULL_42_9]|nr:MAG: hypothetical protein A3F46_02925 [Legionellales bacterium RIFCSPHIGHO2_12_FULL_42_9]